MSISITKLPNCTVPKPLIKQFIIERWITNVLIMFEDFVWSATNQWVRYIVTFEAKQIGMKSVLCLCHTDDIMKISQKRFKNMSDVKCTIMEFENMALKYFL